jgi:hypothetical protein
LVILDLDGTPLWTVSLAPRLTKQAPIPGATGLGSAVTLQWSAMPNETYQVCWDTTDNGTCDTAWTAVGAATTQALTGLVPGTYVWQVRTVGAGAEADNGTWFRFTVTPAPSFAKLAPATGTGGVGPTVTLQWAAVAGEEYSVCWDTTNNTTCDTMWWPNGAATTKTLADFAPGTYYWPVKTAGSGIGADTGTWWSFTVTAPLVPADHWAAEYFGNMTLAGAPASVVDEGTGFVLHDWGTDGPAGLPTDGFSARFTRTVTFAAEHYRFTVVTDDGSRLWIDDQLRIDAWHDQAPTSYTVDVDLSAGHLLLVVRLDRSTSARGHSEPLGLARGSLSRAEGSGRQWSNASRMGGR